MKIIKTQKNEEIIVDDIYFLRLSRHKWRLSSSGYAIRSEHTKTGFKKYKTIQIRMHREIMMCSRDERVDHINGNKLDNIEQNLRLCTYSQNHCNKKIPKNNTSGFKGVYWNKASKKFQAYITIDKKTKYLGLFEKKEDAAVAYNKASEILHKEFSRPNEI